MDVNIRNGWQAIPSFGTLLLSTALFGLALAFVACARIIYNLYLHPLAKYPGPWYARATSLSIAIITCFNEPKWIMGLVKEYGADTPIRIAPNILVFPKASTLKEIYWDPKCNTKMPIYGTGALGPPHIFSTRDPEAHKVLRKALGGPQWTIGYLKNNWEPRLDGLISLFIEKMSERALANDTVLLSERVVEFATDFMTMISFTDPWGFVKNSRDERRMISTWREGLPFFGFVARFVTLRKILSLPVLGKYIYPNPADEHGFGYFMGWADRLLKSREKALDEGAVMKQPDFLQHALNARINGQPLSPIQKRAHATLLIQAGADTTGTSLAATLRMLAHNAPARQRVWEEIQAADLAGKLSTPIKYEETREHLPFMIACMKEATRLYPSAPQLLGRVVSQEGKVIDGHYLPPGSEITTVSYVVHRDPVLYAPDPENWRPERWLESKEKAAEMDLGIFQFGIGPRTCLGKDVAAMEQYKLLPEILRRFDLQLVTPGEYLMRSGVGYILDLNVKLITREPQKAA